MRSLGSLPVGKHHAVLAFPLVLWFTLFQFGTRIPHEYRPEIDVRTLPFLENALFGEAFSFIVETSNNTFVLIAAIPYLLHFVIPWVFAAYLYKTDGKPLIFLWCIGILNTASVLTHLFMPTAPPWYIEKYGLNTPADYSIPGDPGRLREADIILNMPLFERLYGNNPIVFGSFPSLHAAWPFMIATFTSWGHLKWLYVFWVWWAALYLKHHYFLDVIGGVLYTGAVIMLSKFLLARDFEVRGMPMFRRSEKKKTHDDDLEIC